MIAQLTGTLLRIEGSAVVLDVGGVGYSITVPATVLTTLPEPGAKATLLTHLSARIQPDFEITLYGFTNNSQLASFRALTNVQGVGSKVALALLSALTIDELVRALSTSDTKSLTRVSGVGPKLAQRLCLELGDFMAKSEFEYKADRAEATRSTAAENAAYEDAVEALVGLGYSRADARRAADAALASTGNKADAGALIGAGLQHLTATRR